MSSILVVDNEESICDFLSILLEKEGYEVITANNGQTAGRYIRENDFDLVLTDIRMPNSSGIKVLETVKETSPGTPVIMMTAFASAETAVEAMKKGAYDYVSKPFKIEDLKLILKNAIEKKKLHDENAYLKTALNDKYQFSNIIGKSSSMEKVYRLIEKVSRSSATVMVNGESGTGKELVAKAIHFNGPRSKQPFITVNCGAMPENLLESELFGYERGAFTGADSTKVGLLEVADKGSFFLDEIGDTPPSIQVKLLRVLQEKEFTRVGGARPIKIDVRFITATNIDLSKAVEDNKFRQDLYYRLNVIPIYIPPLRERKEDIPALAEHFIQKFNKENEEFSKISGIDPAVMKLFDAYYWPGNVRELENVLERACVFEKGETLQVENLPEEVIRNDYTEVKNISLVNKEGAVDLEKTLDQIEKNMILDALKRTGGIMTKAAKLLNLSFRSMRYRMQKYKITVKTDIEEE